MFENKNTSFIHYNLKNPYIITRKFHITCNKSSRKLPSPEGGDRIP